MRGRLCRGDGVSGSGPGSGETGLQCPCFPVLTQPPPTQPLLLCALGCLVTRAWGARAEDILRAHPAPGLALGWVLGLLGKSQGASVGGDQAGLVTRRQKGCCSLVLSSWHTRRLCLCPALVLA